MGEDEQYTVKAKGDRKVLPEEGRVKGKDNGSRKYSAGLAWFNEAQTSEFLLPFRVSSRVSSGKRSGSGGASRCRTLGVSKSLRCQKIFPLYPFQRPFYPRPQAL